MPHSLFQALIPDHRQVMQVAVAVLAWGALPVPVSRAEAPADVGVETATHREAEMLPVKFGTLSCLRLLPDGNLVAGDSLEKKLKIVEPGGKLQATIDLPFAPEAVNLAPDGTLYCGGHGRLAMLDRAGKILKTAAIPATAKTANVRKAPNKELRVSGIAISDQDVFVAIGSGWSTGSISKLFRFDRDFGNPVVIAEGLRGCCQRCDIDFNRGVLYLAENAAHRVVLMDREGTVISKWGERDRLKIEGFGSCCNPMNLTFDAAGVLYTAESGLGRVKKYSTSGSYLGLVGYIGVERFTNASQQAASCSNIAVAATPDGSIVYVADIKEQRIRVLKKK